MKPYYDPVYEAAIDALIPEAEKIAKQRVEEIGKEWDLCIGIDGKKFRWNYQSAEFHKAMNRLAAEKGLRYGLF